MLNRRPTKEQLATAPVLARHGVPPGLPPVYGCGCIAAVYVTAADDLPYEIRLAHACGTPGCELQREWLITTLHGRVVATYTGSVAYAAQAATELAVLYGRGLALLAADADGGR